jgi:hypothetical protein
MRVQVLVEMVLTLFLLPLRLSAVAEAASVTMHRPRALVTLAMVVRTQTAGLEALVEGVRLQQTLQHMLEQEHQDKATTAVMLTLQTEAAVAAEAVLVA